MKILKNIGNLFISPRFISFYWSVGNIAVIGLLNLLIDNIANIGLPLWAVGVVGLGLNQLTKATKNYFDSKPMGFARNKLSRNKLYGGKRYRSKIKFT